MHEHQPNGIPVALSNSDTYANAYNICHAYTVAYNCKHDDSRCPVAGMITALHT